MNDISRNRSREHMYVEGSPGSGKTSLAITPLVEQLVMRGDRSILVIDLKGDSNELFGTSISVSDNNEASSVMPAAPRKTRHPRKKAKGGQQ